MTNINISFWSTSSPAAADALESLYCASLQPLQPNIEIFRVGDTRAASTIPVRIRTPTAPETFEVHVC